MPGGRPTKFHQDIANEICRRLARGESMRSICKSEDMPDRETVRLWLLSDDKKEFLGQYNRARDLQVDTIFDEIIDIADGKLKPEVDELQSDPKPNIDPATGLRIIGGLPWQTPHAQAKDEKGKLKSGVARDQLRVTARFKWCGRMRPRKYGDFKRLEHTGEDGGPIKIAGQHDPDYLIAEAIRLNLVERLPAALKERAQRLLDAKNPESAGNLGETGQNTGDEPGRKDATGESENMDGPSEGGS